MFKVLHDWLLLGGAHEYTTLRIGCASVFFQLMAVSTAFLWSMGAVEVFVAELVPGCQTMFLRNNKIQQVWRALRNSCGIVVQRLPNVSKCGAACVN